METYDDVMAGVPQLVEETAASFDELPSANGNGAHSSDRDGETPWKDFNAKNDLPSMLRADGWKPVSDGNDEKQQWTRPGKQGGNSATYWKQSGYLKYFTTSVSNTPEELKCDAWGYYVRHKFGGDFKKAAAEYRKQHMPKSERLGQRSDIQANLPECSQARDQAAATAQPESQFRTVSQLYEMDTKNDPTCLLGDRFLCRGGSMLLVGQSGIGKSSLTAQAAVSWALGLDVFGLRPKHALKSVVIQAENDDGDLSEEIQGVLDGLHLAHRRADLDDKVLFFRESVRTADLFTEYVRVQVQLHRPDLLWIDPWLAFLGGDVSDQQTVSKFLRNQLNPIAQEYGCAFVAVHHTGKPPKDNQNRKQSSGDLAYLGIGSSDATNWARAILVLREIEDQLYELRAVKRGRRAGLFETKTANQPGDRAFIQHGESGIFWRAAGAAPGQDEVDARDEEAQEVLDQMGTAAHRWSEVIEIIKKVLGTKTRSTATLFFTKHLKGKLRYHSTKKYTVISPKSEQVRNESDSD